MLESSGFRSGAMARKPATRATTTSSLTVVRLALGCDPRPGQRLAEQRQPDIGANGQLIRRAERHLAGIGLGIFAVVDLTLPLAGAGGLEVLQNRHAQGRAVVGGHHLPPAAHGAVAQPPYPPST